MIIIVIIIVKANYKFRYRCRLFGKKQRKMLFKLFNYLNFQ